jgi:4F5 protein related disordered region
MTRGNQREKAREKNLKASAGKKKTAVSLSAPACSTIDD